MDWGKLIADNFDKVLVIIGTLLGGVLGGGITYFVQSRLQGRQREWALDDQRRQWRREQLSELLEYMEQNLTPYHEFLVSVDNMDAHALENIEHDARNLLEGLGYHASLLVSDKESNELYKTILKEYKKWFRAYAPGADITQMYENSQFIYEKCVELSQRINQLIEATYMPAPSLFQRMIKRLTPKHKRGKATDTHRND